MKADPEAQRRLLDLQAIDIALTQLAHKRKALPEHAELDKLARELSAMEDNRVRAQVAVDDLDRDIERLERDAEQVRARKDKDQARLDAGTGPSRELEALQHEIATLTRRQSELEDAELEFMEQRETAQTALDEVVTALESRRTTRAEAELRREEALAAIAKDEEFRRSGRRPLAADLPADLVGLYDKIRESSGGIGAAMLRHGRCEGCRIELSGGERARVKAAAPDEVVRCEECRRILVRTAESGL
ncbi:C4-type zinc ribbon domain-containing protein [Dactylosporangium sp. NPDC051485]|uniref:zinc ribbon domain-containing protein n=1 Tax=Dactylosporangium sp. NPDC051485 TaxID=3154846 RepID=UPI003416BFB3